MCRSGSLRSRKLAYVAEKVIVVYLKTGCVSRMAGIDHTRAIM